MKTLISLGDRVKIQSAKAISKSADRRLRGTIGIIVEEWKGEFIIRSNGKIVDYSFFAGELQRV